MGRRIRCITFDCYGTLIDWESGITKALDAIPALFGKRDLVRRIVREREEIEKGLLVSAPLLPDEDSPEERYETPEYRPYREILAESILLAARSVGVELTPDEAFLAARTMPEWEPFPDTPAALARIARRFPIGILSNVEEEVIEATLEKLGVAVDLVVTAERVESYKPAPDHWYAAMHELEADEEEILHLAASPFHDLETASLLGIPCGYVNRSGAKLLPEAKPLFTVPDLASSIDRLDRFTPSPGRRPADDRSGRPRAGRRGSAQRTGRPPAGQTGPPISRPARKSR